MDVKFSDLSTPLKTLVVMGWVIISFYVLTFIVGIIIGIWGII